MVIRTVTRKKSTAMAVAARARRRGFRATISKRKDGKNAVSVTRR